MSIYKKYCEEQFDEKGRLVDFRIKCPEDFNFGFDVVDAIAEREPEKTALVWCNPEGREEILTFADIKKRSNQAANVFRKYGISKGDAVMTVLKRHVEYWYVSIALHKLGAVMVPVTHMLTEEDLEYRVNSAEIKAVITSPAERLPERMIAVKNRCRALETIFTVQENADGCVNLSEEIRTASDLLERQNVCAKDPLVMYFTSGTTGQPKGVIHNHTYPLAHIVTAKYWQKAEENGLHFTVAETGWAKTSWGKLYGQWLVGSAVMVFDFDTFDPRQIVNVIHRYHVTTFCAPPTIYRYMVKKDLSKLAGLKNAVTAGETLHPDVFRKFRELTGLTLMEGFGQTETTLLLANFSGDTSKNGSMGTPSPMYHIEIMKEDGTGAKTGEIGEIVIRPRDSETQIGIFSQYHENEALYRYVWRNGVYHTGDTARADEDGYFWFEGRVDEVIKTGGYRVGPFEIENVLGKHPAVLECLVYGVPDALRGQAIKAVVVPAPGYEPSAELQKEVKDFCNANLAEYKWIRILEFSDELKKTISGKIKKNQETA